MTPPLRRGSGFFHKRAASFVNFQGYFSIEPLVPDACTRVTQMYLIFGASECPHNFSVLPEPKTRLSRYWHLP